MSNGPCHFHSFFKLDFGVRQVVERQGSLLLVVIDIVRGISLYIDNLADLATTVCGVCCTLRRRYFIGGLILKNS